MSLRVAVSGLFAFGVLAAALLTRDPRIAMGGLAVVLIAAWFALLVALASRVAGAR